MGGVQSLIGELRFERVLNRCYGLVTETTKREPKGYMSIDPGSQLVEVIEDDSGVRRGYTPVYSGEQQFHPLLFKGQNNSVPGVRDNFKNEDCSVAICDVAETDKIGDGLHLLIQKFEFSFRLPGCAGCTDGASCKKNRNEYSAQMTMGSEGLQVTLVDSKTGQSIMGEPTIVTGHGFRLDDHMSNYEITAAKGAGAKGAGGAKGEGAVKGIVPIARIDSSRTRNKPEYYTPPPAAKRPRNPSIPTSMSKKRRLGPKKTAATKTVAAAAKTAAAATKTVAAAAKTAAAAAAAKTAAAAALRNAWIDKKIARTKRKVAKKSGGALS